MDLNLVEKLFNLKVLDRMVDEDQLSISHFEQLPPNHD